MSVQNQTPFKKYTANGVTTVFPYAFMLLDAGDLVVEIAGVVQSSGFTISGIGASGGGSVTFMAAPANGVKVLLKRDITLQRLTDYQKNGDLLSDTLNTDFDRIWHALQQLQISLLSALKLPFDTPSEQIFNEATEDRVGKLITFNEAGNAILVDNVDMTGTLVTAFAQTLFDDSTAAAARATLDVRSSAESLAYVAPGSSGNLLVSNGTSWASLPNQQLNAFTASVAANALTISAGTLALAFRSPSLNDGSITTVVGDPADLVISNGSTLGTQAYYTERLAVLAILHSTDTIELAVTQITQGKLLQENSLISTTAEAGNADSSDLVYSTTARTNRPFRVLGYIESIQNNAGIWAAAPTVIQNASTFTPIHDIVSQFVSLEQGLSGTVTDITGLPIWAREITIHFESLGTSGTSLPIIQLGSNGGWSSFNYDARGAVSSSSGNTLSAAINSGFPLDGVWSSAVRVTGTMTLHASGAYWYEHFVGARVNATPAVVHSAGYLLPITSDPINKVRITTLGGTDTFTSGYISVKARA